MIKTIHDLGIKFNQTFHPTWIDSYNWADDESSIESYRQASDVIKEFKDNVFICFSKSLLKGEYIVNPKILDEFDQFISFLLDVQKIDDKEDNPLRKQLTVKYQSLMKEVSFLIDSYRYFIINLTNKYRLGNRHYLVSAFSIMGRDETVSPLLNIFIKYELFIYHLEHYFSRSEETVRRLILTKAILEKERDSYSDTIRSIIDIFIDRCSFLLIKLLYNETETEFLLDFERHVLPERTGDESANLLLDDFKFYYKDSYAQNEDRLRPIHTKILKQESLSFQEYVLLFKYYKDSGLGSISQFDNAIRSFESKFKSVYQHFGSRNYDVYAVNTLKNYVYNCRLSFLIDHEKEGLNYSDLKKEMDSIIQIQSETGILNFYPYRKAVKGLINDIRKYIHSSDYNARVFEERFSTLNDYYSKFCSAVKWCEDSSFFPILNLYQDSSRFNDELGIKVYYPSSYSRHVDYDLLRKEIADFEQEIRILNSEKSIKQDFQTLAALKEDIEKSKRTFYEIFGVFTGLVALVFGGISLFSEKDIPSFNTVSVSDAKQLLNVTLSLKTLNFLSFGSCILILISLIFFISLPREKSFGAYFSHPKLWIFLLLLFISSGAIIYILHASF